MTSLRSTAHTPLVPSQPLHSSLAAGSPLWAEAFDHESLKMMTADIVGTHSKEITTMDAFSCPAVAGQTPGGRVPALPPPGGAVTTVLRSG